MVITSTKKLTFEEYLNYQGESGVCYELYRNTVYLRRSPLTPLKKGGIRMPSKSTPTPLLKGDARGISGA